MFLTKDLPFLEKHIQINEKVFIRIFTDKIDDTFFEWHRDKNDRVIKFIHVDSDWKFQYDDQLPMPVQLYQELFIEKARYHRLIKGKGKLIILIEECQND